MMRPPFFVRAFHLLDLSLEEPFFERAKWFSINIRSCFRHFVLALTRANGLSRRARC